MSDTTQPFSARLVAGLIALSLAAFAIMLLLLAFGGQPSSTRDGREHALSIGATGFKALVTLAGRFGPTEMVDGGDDLVTENLVIVTIEPGHRPEEVERLLERRRGRATLLILPKWLTMADPSHRGWVRALGAGSGSSAARALGKNIRVVSARSRPAGTARGTDILDGLRLPVPQSPQTISGDGVEPLVGLAGGGALVARLGDQPHYVAADPDLFNNHGLRDPAAARAALELIARLNATGATGVAFDLTLNDLAANDRPNLLRTALEPPFLPMILALLVAALLAGLHGAFRFGQARREARAIAFGKAALVENSAGLIKLARRETVLGGAYADVVRQDVARLTGAPPALQGEKLDSYLDRLSKADGPPFSALAADLARARSRHELVAAARALFSWKKDIIR